MIARSPIHNDITVNGGFSEIKPTNQERSTSYRPSRQKVSPVFCAREQKRNLFTRRVLQIGRANHGARRTAFCNGYFVVLAGLEVGGSRRSIVFLSSFFLFFEEGGTIDHFSKFLTYVRGLTRPAEARGRPARLGHRRREIRGSS